MHPDSPRHVDHIVETLSQRTQAVFDTALGADRHQRLTQRLERLYGALELARLFDDWRLALRIKTLIDATRRDIEADG
jgi:hypothetical protein